MSYGKLFESLCSQHEVPEAFEWRAEIWNRQEIANTHVDGLTALDAFYLKKWLSIRNIVSRNICVLRFFHPIGQRIYCIINPIDRKIFLYLACASGLCWVMRKLKGRSWFIGLRLFFSIRGIEVTHSGIKRRNLSRSCRYRRPSGDRAVDHPINVFISRWLIRWGIVDSGRCALLLHSSPRRRFLELSSMVPSR